MVQAWFSCGSDVDRNLPCQHNVFHEFCKGGSVMVHAWFMRGSGVVQVRPWRVWAWAGTPTGSIVSSTCRSMVARLWFRCGSGVVHARFRCGSDVDGNVKCNGIVLRALFNGSSVMVQVWSMCGSGVVQVRPKCVWAWVGTPTAAIMSSTFRSLVARQWFRRGSGMVQAWFRCGSEGHRNAKCKRNIFHAVFKDGSIIVQVWFMCGSGVVQVRPRWVWA